jgi:hypothetical protein
MLKNVRGGGGFINRVGDGTVTSKQSDNIIKEFILQKSIFSVL